MDKFGRTYLFYTLLLVCYVLSSCSPLDTDNKQHFSDVISIITTENGTKYLKNSYSLFLSSGLDTIPEGTCGFASFTVNYDKQPDVVPPYRSELISWNTLNTSPFKDISGTLDDPYKELISSISSNQCFDQFMFLSVNQKIPDDCIYEYELLCNKDSVDNDNVITMYLKAKIGLQGTDTVMVNKNVIVAFDILPFLKDQINQGNDSLILFNLKYSYATDSIGNLIYSSYKENPVKISLTK